MVHVFNDAIDSPCQFSRLIERAQVAKVPAIFAADQGVLYVLADGSVNIPPGGLIVPEGGVLRVNLGVLKGQFPSPESSAVADILIDPTDAQQTAVLTVRNKGGMDGPGPVVQLLMECEPKTQGVRTGQDDLHTLGRVYIRQQGSGVDEVSYQRDFVQQNITETQSA